MNVCLERNGRVSGNILPRFIPKRQHRSAITTRIADLKEKASEDVLVHQRAGSSPTHTYAYQRMQRLRGGV